MVPEFVLNAVVALGSGRPGQSGRAEALRLLPQLQPGDLVTAQVEAKLGDGSFKVVVAGQTLRMNLPAGVVPGETFELELLGREPLSFAFKGAVTAEPAPSLSRGARLISGLLPEAASEPLTVAKPMLAAPSRDAAVLSGALERILKQTGLFYESHQAQWLQGRLPLEDLRQEPQSRVATHSDASVIDAQALPVVQQQLALLDNGRIALQLELWPGQWMRWEIEERDEPPQHQHAQDADAIPRSWQTRLKMDLPRLGAVDAALSLDARGVAVRISAGKEPSAALLATHGAALKDALTVAGITPLAVEIRHADA